MRFQALKFCVVILSLPLFCAGCLSERQGGAKPEFNPQKTQALAELRDEINSHYGFREGVPRVNLGPCGRVARDFREEWNATFSQKINIAFVMSADKSQCYHVLVKLPDGRFFDGGNGVMS